MWYKFYLALILANTSLLLQTGVKQAVAQPNQIITGQQYLAFNQTHKVIYLRQLIAGQKNLVLACAPDLTIEEIAAYVSQWLQKNPLNLNRPANLAFTQAIKDRCQQQTKEKNSESTVTPFTIEHEKIKLIGPLQGSYPPLNTAFFKQESIVPDLPLLGTSINYSFASLPQKERQNCLTKRSWFYCRELIDSSIVKQEETEITLSFFEHNSNKAKSLGDIITVSSPFATTLSSFVVATNSELEDDSAEPSTKLTEDNQVSSVTLTYPRIEGVLKVGLFNINIFEATSKENEFNDLFPDIILNSNLFLTKEVYFNTAVRFFPAVFPPEPRRDRFFEDLTLRLGALNFNYETDNFYLGLGKGTTLFSMAFRSAPGIFGRDIAESDIRVPVRIGITTGGEFDGGSLGNYALTGSAFFLDTSVLNEPFFTNFGRPRLANGGPSNTETLESFLVALDGTNFKVLPSLRTHVAFMRQKVNRLQPPGANLAVPNAFLADEYRTVVAAQCPIQVSEDITLTPLIEYARFWNASGIKNQYRDYLTTSVQFLKGNWNLALASTLWLIDNPVGNDFSNLQFQVSGGYLFDNALSFDVGYRFLEIENEGTHAIGLWLNYSLGL